MELEKIKWKYFYGVWIYYFSFFSVCVCVCVSMQTKFYPRSQKTERSIKCLQFRTLKVSLLLNDDEKLWPTFPSYHYFLIYVLTSPPPHHVGVP